MGTGRAGIAEQQGAVVSVAVVGIGIGIGIGIGMFPWFHVAPKSVLGRGGGLGGFGATGNSVGGVVSGGFGARFPVRGAA